MCDLSYHYALVAVEVYKHVNIGKTCVPQHVSKREAMDQKVEVHLKNEFQKYFKIFLQIVNCTFTTKTMYLLKLFLNPGLFQVTLILKTISK